MSLGGRYAAMFEMQAAATVDGEGMETRQLSSTRRDSLKRAFRSIYYGTRSQRCAYLEYCTRQIPGPIRFQRLWQIPGMRIAVTVFRNRSTETPALASLSWSRIAAWSPIPSPINGSLPPASQTWLHSGHQRHQLLVVFFHETSALQNYDAVCHLYG